MEKIKIVNGAKSEITWITKATHNQKNPQPSQKPHRTILASCCKIKSSSIVRIIALAFDIFFFFYFIKYIEDTQSLW